MTTADDPLGLAQLPPWQALQRVRQLVASGGRVPAGSMTRGRMQVLVDLVQLRRKVFGPEAPRAPLFYDPGTRRPTAEEDDEAHRLYARVSRIIRHMRRDERRELQRAVVDLHADEGSLKLDGALARAIDKLADGLADEA